MLRQSGSTRFEHQTLGYPGEGPWSLMSANIDAFHSHPDCVQWDADVIALQETRLSINNFSDARHLQLVAAGSDRIS